MSNIITLEDLEEEEDYQALLEDLRQGCEQLGQVVSMHVPRLQVDYGMLMNVEWRGGAGSGLCFHSVYNRVGGSGGSTCFAIEDV